MTQALPLPRVLSAPLAIFLATLISTGGLSYLVWQKAQETTQQAKTAAQEALRQQQKTRQLQNDEQTLRDKIERYKLLEQQGLIGPERRLDWVELMRNVQTEHRLFDLDYEISPQTLVPPTQLPLAPTGHNIYSSSMRLRLPLLHEGDLLLLLNQLRERASAMIRVRECLIERKPSQADQAVSPQLDASCQLDWVTLRSKTEAR